MKRSLVDWEATLPDCGDPGCYGLGGRSPSARLWSLPAALQHLKIFASSHAGKAGKCVSLDVSCPAILVGAGFVETLIPTLVQLLRNAIDHGVEFPTERLVAGKPLTGAIKITVETVNRITLRVSDDGRGVEPGLYRRPFVSNVGAKSKTVFKSGTIVFSAGSHLSRGAGVDRGRSGLARAAGRLARIGASLVVESRSGLGTEVSVNVPRKAPRDLIIALHESASTGLSALTATSLT